MTLKAQYESSEEIPEALKEYYSEANGKFAFVGVEGFKPQADVDKLTKALESERKLKAQLKDQVTAFESKFAGKGSPDEILAQLERIPVLEAEREGKIDQRKLDQILEVTVKQRMAPLEHEINKHKATIAEREAAIAAFEAADRRRTIHDAVRAIAAKEGFHESTYSNPEGALMLLADRNLTINHEGKVVVTDDNSIYTAGLPLAEALGQIKQQHSYMLKQSVGGGASGSGGTGGASGNNPFKQNNKTLRGQFMQQHPDKWEGLMKQAGLDTPFDDYRPGK